MQIELKSQQVEPLDNSNIQLQFLQYFLSHVDSVTSTLFT